jgi:cytochrome c556
MKTPLVVLATALFLGGCAAQPSEPARQRQPRAALEAFHKLQSACMACHLEFRQPYLTQFYGS